VTFEGSEGKRCLFEGDLDLEERGLVWCGGGRRGSSTATSRDQRAKGYWKERKSPLAESEREA